jgi:cytoskeletal protein RodZ
MKNTKTLLAIIPLVAIATISIGVGMSSNVLAQPTAPATVDPQDSPNAVDQKDSPNEAADGHTEATNTADNGTDNQKDGETNDYHNSAQEGPHGDGDGEQKDSTELKK